MFPDQIDNQIMKTLEGEPRHPSELARLTGLPRTTITYRLSRLLKQKLVTSKNIGRKIVWSMDFKPEKDRSPFKIYSGDNFSNAYLECLNIKPKSVILSIQGVGAASNELKGVPRSLIFKVHKRFKQKGIVFKSIANIKLLDVFHEIDDNYIKSHIGRSGGLKLFKNDLFLGDGEIVVCEQFIIVTNPKIKMAISIKDKELVGIFYQTLSLLFDSLEEIRGLDLNDYLKKIVEKTKL